MGCAVRGPDPGGGEIFSTCPDRPKGPPVFVYSGYRLIEGGEGPDRDANHSPPSSAEVKDTTIGRTSLGERTHIPLPDNTQHSDVHVPSGILTRNPSTRAAADPPP
jgi:hypothetical protein